MPELKVMKDHPFARMLKTNLCVTLNTDNRLVSNTTTVAELKKGIEAFRLSPKQLRDIVITGFKRSFYPGPYEERRAYVRKVMDYYDHLAKEHGIAPAS